MKLLHCAVLFLAATGVSCTNGTNRVHSAGRGLMAHAEFEFIDMTEIFKGAAVAMARDLGTELKASASSDGLCLSPESPECTAEEGSPLVQYGVPVIGQLGPDEPDDSQDGAERLPEKRLDLPGDASQSKMLYSGARNDVHKINVFVKQAVILSEPLEYPPLHSVQIDVSRPDFKAVVQKEGMWNIQVVDTNDLTPRRIWQDPADEKSPIWEKVPVNPGQCKYAEVYRRTTVHRYAAEYEIPISGDVLMLFGSPVDIPGANKEADFRLISVSELLTNAQTHGIGKTLTKSANGEFSVKSKIYITDTEEKYESEIFDCLLP